MPASVEKSRTSHRLVAVATLLSFGLIAPLGAAQLQRSAGGQQLAANLTAPPQCDANCVRSNASYAAQACAPRIEAQSPSGFNWIARPNAGIFQQADPSSPGDSVVRYRGDSIRFLTSEKNWLQVSYECAFDVRSKEVVFVHVRFGRLGQPLTPAVRSAPLAAAIRAMVPGAVTTGTAAKPKKRVHVGEPSPVEIEQQNPNPKLHSG